MTKLEELEAAINSLPNEYKRIRNMALAMLGMGLLHEMKSYVFGLQDMATHLTSDEEVLSPLRHIRELLK